MIFDKYFVRVCHLNNKTGPYTCNNYFLLKGYLRKYMALTLALYVEFSVLAAA